MYKNSKHTVLFPLLLAAGVVLGLVLGQYLGRNTTTSQLKGMLSRMALPDNKLSYTLSLIENQYVDSVSMDSLAEHVIPMLVKELDPHSVYIPAAEMHHARSDGADTDSHGANEDKGIIAVEVFRCEFAGGFYMCASLFVPEGEDFGVGKFVEQ